MRWEKTGIGVTITRGKDAGRLSEIRKQMNLIVISIRWAMSCYHDGIWKGHFSLKDESISVSGRPSKSPHQQPFPASPPIALERHETSTAFAVELWNCALPTASLKVDPVPQQALTTPGAKVTHQRRGGGVRAAFPELRAEVELVEAPRLCSGCAETQTKQSISFPLSKAKACQKPCWNVASRYQNPCWDVLRRYSF